MKIIKFQLPSTLAFCSFKKLMNDPQPFASSRWGFRVEWNDKWPCVLQTMCAKTLLADDKNMPWLLLGKITPRKFTKHLIQPSLDMEPYPSFQKHKFISWHLEPVEKLATFGSKHETKSVNINIDVTALGLMIRWITLMCE